MSTYAEKSELYRDLNERNRMVMCVREQGYIYSADGRPDIASLGHGVVAGNMVDIDAVVAAVVTAPGIEGIGDDAVLLGAVQTVWPTVAAARYPQA